MCTGRNYCNPWGFWLRKDSDISVSIQVFQQWCDHLCRMWWKRKWDVWSPPGLPRGLYIWSFRLYSRENATNQLLLAIDKALCWIWINALICQESFKEQSDYICDSIYIFKERNLNFPVKHLKVSFCGLVVLERKTKYTKTFIDVNFT